MKIIIALLTIAALTGCANVKTPIPQHSGVGWVVENTGDTIISTDNVVNKWTHRLTFQTGKHVKEFEFCGDGIIFETYSSAQMDITFHWDASQHCDSVDDVVLVPRIYYVGGDATWTSDDSSLRVFDDFRSTR